jgi:hypothetical protein
LVALSPMALLAPVGVAEAALALAPWPSLPASGSFPISAFLRLLEFDAVQTRTMGAAVVELLLLGHRYPLEPANRVGGSSNLWEICLPKCLETLM